MKRLAVALLFSATLIHGGTVAAQVPSLTHTLPYAVPPGATTKVTFYGDKLDTATGIWTNLPGAEARLEQPAPDQAPAAKAAAEKNAEKKTTDKKPVEKPKAVANRLNVDLTVPKDAVPGIYGVRVVTASGATNLRLLMVDDLPTTREDTSNKTTAKAQLLTLPTAVDGVCEAESYDFYKFHAEAGQRLSVEAVARRLGSQLDPVVRLLDAAGHELAYADDDESTGPDGRFTYRFQKSGDYFVEIRDIRYAGGANHRYRLRFGDFPLLAAPYPMGVQAGTTSLVQAVGVDVGPLEPLRTSVPATFAAKQMPLAVSYAPGQGSGLTMLTVAHSTEQTESEPNDAREGASPLSAAGAVNGRFEQPKDRDLYRFDAKKGTRLRFVGRTRGCGSPTDLFLRLLDKEGKVLAEAEDSGLEEGVLDYTFAADGAFILSAEDLLGRGGPEFSYRIEIAPYQPGFALAIDAEKLDVPHGGVGKVKVTAIRAGFTGPIQLKIVPAGKPLELAASGTIPEGKPDGVLTITAAAGVPTGTLANVQVVGEGAVDKEGKQMVSAVAVATTPLKTLLGGLSNPPVALAENLAIAIGPPFADFLKVSTPAKTITLPQLVGKTSFAVKVEKLNKFDDVVTLAVEGLPAGVTAAPAKIEKGKAEATIELTGPAGAAPLEQKFRVVASATLTDQPKKYTLDDLTLRIAPPIESQVAAPAPFAPGEKRKLKITVVRNGGKPAPVTLRWKSLPRGIAGAKELVIAADKNEVEAELTVDPKAPLGPGAGRLSATTVLDGRTVTLDVGTIALKVAPAAEPKKTAAK